MEKKRGKELVLSASTSQFNTGLRPAEITWSRESYPSVFTLYCYSWEQRQIKIQSHKL